MITFIFKVICAEIPGVIPRGKTNDSIAIFSPNPECKHYFVGSKHDIVIQTQDGIGFN
jgi:hypothetical protein